MEAGGAYGAGKAGAGFDPISYIKKPQVILRIISWVFAVIVFGCIAAEGKQKYPTTGIEYCVYNNQTGACGFGIAIGVFAFLACTLFLVIDALFDNLSNITHRKYAVIGDLAFSAVWCFMWFVCFCFLTDAWRNTKAEDKPPTQSQVKAAIAFSFFSVIPWAGLTVLAFMRYRQGSQSAFSPSYEPEPSSATNPYSSFPGDTAPQGDAYQQPPFGEKTGVPDSQYQAPSY